jgi:hypothetical protein
MMPCVCLRTTTGPVMFGSRSAIEFAVIGCSGSVIQSMICLPRSFQPAELRA